MEGKTIQTAIQDTDLSNFPIKSFYSSVTNKCYVFYRQGHGFTIDAKDPSNTRVERII